MGAQLLGVLREIVAARGSTPPAARSTCFTPPARGSLDGPDWRTLPTPLVDPDDPAAAVIVSMPDPDEVIRRLGGQRGAAVETDLWLARALIQRDRLAEAHTVLDGVDRADHWGWRATWYRGLAALAAADAEPARAAFDRVYGTLPGELAPKLALALSHEVGGDWPRPRVGTRSSPAPTRRSRRRRSGWRGAEWRWATGPARSPPTAGSSTRRAPTPTP